MEAGESSNMAVFGRQGGGGRRMETEHGPS